MNCPLGLDKVHCQDCYWLECKLKLINAIEEFKDNDGTINMTSQEWNDLVQRVYATRRV